MKERFLHFLFPEVCVICGKMLLDDERGFCHGCRERFDAFTDAPAAGFALMHVIESHFSGKNVLSSACCRYVFHQHSPLQKALHAMKYGGLYGLGLDFGRDLGYWISSVLPPSGVDCLVPVPLHRLKHVERSFNQAEKIALGIAESFQKPVRTDLLARGRYTVTQTGLAIAARRKNLEGAFLASGKEVPPHVLLVDDVVTTGATVVAAAEALLRAGAKRVSVAALALAAKE